MADDAPLPARVGLYCEGYGECRLPHGHLHAAGRVLVIHSYHHGQKHTWTGTLDELAAHLGYRLVPLAAEEGPRAA